SEKYQAKWPNTPMVCEAWHDSLSARSKKHWDKVTPEQRTIEAKKRMTPERRKKQSITISKVRAGLTGLTSEKLEEWRINAKNAIGPEVRKHQSETLKQIWAERVAKLEQARILDELSNKPVPWRRIVPLLLINRDLSNAQAQDLAGIKPSERLSRSAMNRVRIFAGVRGLQGRRAQKL
ncbi:MAG: hypothetical protein WCA19_22875, partial [Candidatus Acidiferrales bacterium]